MSKTIEIDNLLKKVVKVSALVEETIKRSDRKKYSLKDFSMPQSMQWLIDLKNEHFLYFKFPKSRSVMKGCEIETRAKIDSFKEWNQSLFSLLKLNILFSGNSWVHFAGTYSGRDITINSYHESFMWETTVHEIGHAWNFQLCGLANLDVEVEAQKVVKDVAKYLNWDKQIINFNFAKQFLRNKISHYSGKDWIEAFAEIFKAAYTERNYEPSDDKLIKRACRYAIEQYNNRIIVKLWNKKWLAR